MARTPRRGNASRDMVPGMWSHRAFPVFRSERAGDGVVVAAGVFSRGGVPRPLRAGKPAGPQRLAEAGAAASEGAPAGLPVPVAGLAALPDVSQATQSAPSSATALAS